VVDDRRLREHHRGVVAGAVRLDRLRPVAQRRKGWRGLMAAPEYVPVSLNDLPRLTEPIPAAGHWKADRPADLKGRQPVGPKLGRPGPDQGYALRLARRFEDRLEVAPTEDRDDAVAGCLGVALKRASIFGR